jgi:mRNA interferase MazF
MTGLQPKTGDIFVADLEPVKGSEQGKKRPVIVFQNPDVSVFTTTVICIPLTSNMARLGFPGTCFIKKGIGGLPDDSIALCFQMRAIDRARLGKRYGKIESTALSDLANSILSALGIQYEDPK